MEGNKAILCVTLMILFALKFHPCSAGIVYKAMHNTHDIHCNFCVAVFQIADYASAQVGFESLQYEAPESSNLDVCIVVNGSLIYSFDLLVTTHAATASESKTCITLLSMHACML